MYDLGVCELFHPQLLGQDANSSKGVEGHYLVHLTFGRDEYFNGEHSEWL